MIRLAKADRPLIAFISIHALLFVGLFVVLALFYYPKTGEAELFVSSKIFQGLVPYQDSTLEYPPLAILFFLIPRLFSDAVPLFSYAFAVELLVADMMILFLISRLALRQNVSSRHLLAVYTLMVLGIGPIIATRYDLWPAALMLLGLFAFARGKTKLAWAAIALNVGAKLYGAIIIPLFIIHHLFHRQYRRLLEGGIVFLAISIALVLPWLIIDAGGFLRSMSYHLERGLHSESSYGALLLVGQLLGITRVSVDFGFGSWNVYSPLADALARESFLISGGALLALYLVFARVVWARRNAALNGKWPWLSDEELLYQYSFLVLVVFLLTSKVFSAQYMVWLCPLIPLFTRDRQYVLMSLFFAAGLLTQYVFPYYYGDFLAGKVWAVIPMLARDVALLAIAVLMIRPKTWTRYGRKTGGGERTTVKP